MEEAAGAASEATRSLGNPFADESFEVDAESFLDMGGTPAEPQEVVVPVRRGSNPFVSPLQAEEGPESALVDSGLPDRLRQSVEEDNFRSSLPDDDFQIASGSPLFVASPESNLVPITTEKEEILSDFRRYNLDAEEIQLISRLPDAVARAALEQLRGRAGAEGPQDPPPAAERPETEVVAAASRGAEERPEPEEMVPQEAWAVDPEPEEEEEGEPSPAPRPVSPPKPVRGPPVDLAKVEALDGRLQHIEEVVCSLSRKGDAEAERERERERGLEVIQGQQAAMVAKDDAIASLTRERDALAHRLRDMLDRNEVDAAISAREQHSLEETAKIVNEYEARLDHAKSEKKELLDRVEYLLGERRDFNKLEGAFEALRNDNVRLQEELGSERHRSECFLREIREISQHGQETGAICVELKSRLEKADADVESLKAYIVDCNSQTYQLRMQAEDLQRENRALRAENVNLGLDLTHQQEEISNLRREVKSLEASKRRLQLSPGRTPELSGPPRDQIQRIPPAPASPPCKEVLTPRSASNREAIESIYGHIRRGHDQRRPVVAGTRAPEPLEAKENLGAPEEPMAVAKPQVVDPLPASVEPRRRPSQPACPYAVDVGGPAGQSEEEKIERLLLKMNLEKQSLESQYAKMPATSGRTLAQRKQKREIEERLTGLNREISSSRLALKRLQAAR